MRQNFTVSRRTRWIIAITMLIVALALVAARPITARAQNNTSGGDQPASGAGLLPATENGQQVRVIVTLNVATSPEGELAGAADVDAQRAAIASTQDAVLDDLGGNASVNAQYATIPALALTVNEAGLEELLQSDSVVHVVEDVPLAADLASSIPVIDADLAWGMGFEGTGRMVAVLDTGVEASHSFFGGRVTHQACFSTTDSLSGSTSLCPNGSDSQTGNGSASPSKCSGITGCDHGTHVAGIAAGNGTNDGVARMSNILAIQVFSKFTPAVCGSTNKCVLSWSSDQMAALDYILDNRATLFPNLDAINISIGGGQYFSFATCDATNASYKALIDNLKSVGVATVIAAGNNGWNDAMNFPGCISTAITVGATEDNDVRAGYTNAASWLDLWAPGSNITSSITGNNFGSKSGTSMATPHVTGAFALLRSVDTTTSVDQIMTTLLATGVSVADVNVTTDRIDLDGAALALNNTPNTPSNPSPADNATGVATNTSVSWTGGDPDGDVVTFYDVYLDTNPSPTTLVCDNVTVETCNPPGILLTTTTYYWKVAATDGSLSATGPVWSFTTSAVVIDENLIPNGGFEDNVDGVPLIPDGWTPKSLSGTDHIDCSEANEGTCSFTFTSNGSSKKLVQTILTPGASGDYTLSFDTQGIDVRSSGSYIVKLKFYFTNGTNKTYKIKVTDTDDFTWLTKSLPINLTLGYTKLEVTVQFGKKGIVWFDDVRLIKN